MSNPSSCEANLPTAAVEDWYQLMVAPGAMHCNGAMVQEQSTNFAPDKSGEVWSVYAIHCDAQHNNIETFQQQQQLKAANR